MPVQESKLTLTEVVSIGSMAEAAVGVALIALAIIGLAKIAVEPMIAIATIIVGVALLMQGTETAAEATTLSTGISASAGSGIMVEFLAGAAGIVLGILAFVDGNAMSIAPAALIVFGGALLLAGTASSLSSIGPIATLAIVRQARIGASGAQIMIGVTVIVLGILAYVLPSIGPTLTLVGLLNLGASLIVTSAAIGFPQFVENRAQEGAPVVTPNQPVVGE
jgi:hypothetical protein